ncbi:hypothetical protein ABE218_00840 [Bacillus smithii]|uniref:hypothetical protein n=1 Tax=Bacillus smithii TaxID=1479 RepID=UPI003D250AAB
MFFALVVALFLQASYWYWKEKTTVDSTDVVTPVSENGSNESWQDLSSHCSDQARKQLEKSFQDGKPFQAAIVGSKALGKEDNGWSVQLKKALETAYRPVLKVSIGKEDGTSLDFLQNGEIEKIADSKPDMILFEPFTWADNGNVSVDDNHTFIQTFVRDVKADVRHDRNCPGNLDRNICPKVSIFFLIRMNQQESFILNEWLNPFCTAS